MIQTQISVMPGLAPGIHGLAPFVRGSWMGRIKSGHDEKVNRMSESEH
jgi:hypothetical protein